VEEIAVKKALRLLAKKLKKEAISAAIPGYQVVSKAILANKVGNCIIDCVLVEK